ncbi:MAG: enoyl-CoA hydratase/isomerase family protein, partial [Pseudomonadota bacterium]
PPPARLQSWQPEIATLFESLHPAQVIANLARATGPAARRARDLIARNAPMAMACALAIQQRLAPDSTVTAALDLEYRYTHRAMQQGDFLEGIRAAIIDKDRAPNWRHATLADVTDEEVAAMLAPVEAKERQ